MSQHYIFNESGSIPGIPGTFSNCRVDIDEVGNLLALPLAQHPAIEASTEAETPPIVAVSTPPTEAAPTPDIVQEQVPPGLALNIG